MKDSIQSIQRAAALLRSFTERTPELGVMELSRQHSLHKSTVSRILSTLQQEGMVSQNPETGKYRLGLGLISLAGVALGRIDIRGVAQPYLTPLLALVQETITVGILDGDEAVNVERLSSPRALRYVGWIGRRIPLHCTASGRALIAWLPPEERRRRLPAVLPAYTPYTETSPAALEEILADVRRQEFALAREEFEVGITSIAAPVRNHTGQVIATVSIAGPSSRLDDAALAEIHVHLLYTVGAISAELGYRVAEFFPD